MAATDIDREIPLAEAKFPGNPHIATRWRWKSKGVKRGDRVVRLKTITCGGRTFVTQRWANEFVAACNADTPRDPQESAADAQRRSREAGRALEKMGC